MKINMFKTIEGYKAYWEERIELTRKGLENRKAELEEFKSKEHPNWNEKESGTIEHHIEWLEGYVRYYERQLKKEIKEYQKGLA